MIIFDQYIYDERPDADDDIIVFHSGFCSTLPNYSFGRDTRDYYLIHYVTSGKGVYSTQGVNYNLSKHDGFLILPDMPIVHTADAEEPWNLCWVAFLGKKVESYLAQAGLGKDNLLFRYTKDDYLETRIKDIYNESRSKKNIATITGHFMLLLGRLIDSANETPNGERKLESIGFTHFEDAMNYINRHIHIRVSVEELSSYLRLDTSQIYRIFKKRTGMSPQNYMAKLRMEKACSLLSKTDLTIKDISEWLNFEYQSHFTKQFKNVNGVSPTEYRKNKVLNQTSEISEHIP